MATLAEDFALFMRKKGLSERTIKKYSVDTPNCPSVQAIIQAETGGVTNNMYHVTSIAVIDRIIDRISSSPFDRIGHSMYSAGLKKYKAFLES